MSVLRCSTKCLFNSSYRSACVEVGAGWLVMDLRVQVVSALVLVNEFVGLKNWCADYYKLDLISYWLFEQSLWFIC